MSFIDKFLHSVRLSDEDYEDDDYMDEEDYYEEDEEDDRSRRGFFGFRKKKRDDYYDEIEEEPAPAKLTPMRGGRGSSKMQVCVIKPSKYEDVTEIADTLLSNNTVILNVEGLDHSTAQRIIDFMTGSCYSIDGNLQKIANYIFIITPQAVSLSGDIQGLMNAVGEARMASGSLQSF